ncbi:hypothetical protein RCL1_005835 [Eukaryota sp. TZLM3-RCL]
MELNLNDSLFCEACGTFLSLSPQGFLSCPCCKRAAAQQQGILQKSTVMSNLKPVSYNFDEDEESKQSQDVVISETCPKCGHDKMSFRTMQLRSVDEGSTVFYTCLNTKCKFTYSLNN